MRTVIPILRSSDLARSLAFYTQVLDFELADPDDAGPVIDLVHGDARLQMTALPECPAGCAINVQVDDVDALFATFVARGLDTSGRPESPVHQGPIDQTWGMREFYVTDPDGNTLRFRRPIA